VKELAVKQLMVELANSKENSRFDQYELDCGADGRTCWLTDMSHFSNFAQIVFTGHFLSDKSKGKMRAILR
jgi:hypothetical protein